MGVLGLWQLLNPTSRSIKLESLEGKILAIDISIWLHQAAKGSMSKNAHILMLYNRICKLLYFKIKPIFVFDGPEVPIFKKRVLQERQKRRQAASNKAKEIDDQLKKKFLEQYVLNQLNPNESTTESVKVSDKRINDDIFKINFDDYELNKDESEEEETNNENYIAANYDINTMDQEVFEQLPVDIQMELLSNYKEKLKNKRGEIYQEFPDKSEDFSSFQMKSLLHKSEIAKKINDLRKSIKQNIDLEHSFDNVFHEKISSEDDRIILFLSNNTKNNKVDFLKTLKTSDDSNTSETHQTQTIDEFEEKVQNLFSIYKERKINESEEQDDDVDDIIVEEKAAEKNTTRDQEDEIQITEEDNNTQKIIWDSGFESREHTNVKESFTSMIVDDDLSPPKQKREKIEEKVSEIVKKDLNGEIGSEIIKTQIILKNTNRPNIEETCTQKSFKEISDGQMRVLESHRESQVETIIETSSSSSDDDDFVEVSISEKKDETEKEVIEETTNKDAEIQEIDLNERNEQLNIETEYLLKEKQKETKLSNNVDSYLVEDAKYLLQLFGIPYIIAPGEAEAQCAYLDLTNQTNGTITEDSDIWLFGANNVYRSFFKQNALIESYSSQLIKSQLGVDRNTLICIAMLVGSDYTLGIENVGIVKAMEILQEFNGENIDKLWNFKNWYNQAKTSNKKTFTKIQNLLLKLNVPDSFPNEAIYDSYKKPNIDENRDEFSWSMPDLHLIRQYLNNKLNWDAKKVDETLLPVIKRMNDQKIQKTIDTFFNVEPSSILNKQSKRMKNAIKSFKKKNIASSNDDNLSDISDTNEELQINSSKKQDDDLNLSDEETNPVQQCSSILKINKKTTKRKPRKRKSD